MLCLYKGGELFNDKEGGSFLMRRERIMKISPAGRSQCERDSGYLAEPIDTALKKIGELWLPGN